MRIGYALDGKRKIRQIRKSVVFNYNLWLIYGNLCLKQQSRELFCMKKKLSLVYVLRYLYLCTKTQVCINHS